MGRFVIGTTGFLRETGMSANACRAFLSDLGKDRAFSRLEPALYFGPQLNKGELTRGEPVEIVYGAGIDHQPCKFLCCDRL
jgi:hypothetical protein